ncbi:MAG: hypothetical protein EXS05_23920 [Planctomycetaceae bacterium]|nr:hypothetical protein [Planctomycetaceae bacterium]
MGFWSFWKRILGGGGDRMAQHLAELDDRFRAFLGQPHGIAVTIKRAVPDQGANAVILEMEVSRPPKNATEFLSFVKARLLVDMYRAANHVHQRLGEGDGSTGIQAAGRSFMEPAYYVPVGNQNIGPISFRQGDYSNGKISFCLMIVGGSIMVMHSPPPAFMQSLEKLAEGYVKGVRELSL